MATPAHPLVILIHDDDRDVLETMADTLVLDGHTVIGIAQAIRSGDLVLRNGPDVVIMDLMLGGRQSGVELARDLIAGNPGLPIVAISASVHMLEGAVESGVFVSVLAKPFDIVDLLDCVTQAAGSSAGDSREDAS